MCLAFCSVPFILLLCFFSKSFTLAGLTWSVSASRFSSSSRSEVLALLAVEETAPPIVLWRPPLSNGDKVDVTLEGL